MIIKKEINIKLQRNRNFCFNFSIVYFQLSKSIVYLIKNFFKFFPGDLFGIEEVLEKVLYTFDCKFEIDSLYKFFLSFFIRNSGESEDTDFFHEIWWRYFDSFFDMIKKQFCTFIGLIFFVCSLLIEERMRDRSHSDFLNKRKFTLDIFTLISSKVQFV